MSREGFIESHNQIHKRGISFSLCINPQLGMPVGRSDSSQTLQDKVIRRLQVKPLFSYSTSLVRQSKLNYRAGHKCIDHPLSLYYPELPRSMPRISKIISAKLILVWRSNPIQGGEVRAWPCLANVELK